MKIFTCPKCYTQQCVTESVLVAFCIGCGEKLIFFSSSKGDKQKRELHRLVNAVRVGSLVEGLRVVDSGACD